MSRWQEIARCYCARCHGKRNGFTDETGQQRLNTLGFRPNQTITPHGPHLPLDPGTVLSESTNLRGPIGHQFAPNATGRDNWNENDDLSEPIRDPSGALSRCSRRYAYYTAERKSETLHIWIRTLHSLRGSDKIASVCKPIHPVSISEIVV